MYGGRVSLEASQVLRQLSFFGKSFSQAGPNCAKRPIEADHGHGFWVLRIANTDDDGCLFTYRVDV
jgi:hypothetical protein